MSQKLQTLNNLTGNFVSLEFVLILHMVNIHSPIKFQRKEFSLSESLIERGIEVFEEEKSGAFDGDIPDFEEINEKISSTIKKMTPTDSGMIVCYLHASPFSDFFRIEDGKSY